MLCFIRNGSFLICIFFKIVFFNQCLSKFWLSIKMSIFHRTFRMLDFMKFRVNYSCKFPYLFKKNVFWSHKEMLIFGVYRLLYLETKWSIEYFLYLYDFSKNDTLLLAYTHSLAIFFLLFFSVVIAKFFFTLHTVDLLFGISYFTYNRL